MYKFLFSRKLFRFVIVGGIGFSIDGGLLTILMQKGWNVISARVFSFSLAVSCTWFLNRYWTFNQRKVENIRWEYAYYFGTQVLGAIINLSVFFASINLYSILADNPLMPLAFGAMVALVFNYVFSRNYVFKR